MYQTGFTGETFDTESLESFLSHCANLAGIQAGLVTAAGQVLVGDLALPLATVAPLLDSADEQEGMVLARGEDYLFGVMPLAGVGKPRLYLVGVIGHVEPAEAQEAHLAHMLEQLRQVVQVLIRKELQLDGLAQETLLRYEELNLLYEMGEVIISNQTIDEIADQMLARAVLSTDAKGGVIALFEGEDEAEDLVVRAVMDWGSDRAPKGKSLSVTEGLLADAISQRRPRIYSNIEDDQIYGTPNQPVRLRSLLFIPLYTTARRVGSMILVNKQTDPYFTASDEKLGLAIATQAAIAIENNRLQARIREEERIGANLQRYVSPNVVRAVLERGGLQDLIGDRWKATVAFIDIRDFSVVVERTAPDVIIELLNEYFRAMTDIIFRHQGAIDEFAGDELLAFFGIPFAMPDGAENAVRAAVEVIQRIDTLKQDWTQRGLPTFDVGVGLNTGWVAVGNIGSERRMELTVVGPPVVVASRVEELNKEFGTRILITEATLNKVRDLVHVRPMGRHELKGISQPREIYELLNLRETG
jgi:class 3 adenylate cyclase